MLPRLLVVAIVLAPLPSFGEARLAATGAANWPKECRTDVSRTCRETVQEEDKVTLTCLVDNEKKLSPGCRKLLQSYGHLPK